MKEEQGSWGTNPLINNNSPREEESEDDDPDFEEQRTSKKKYTYRKEVQRSYRQRVKSKKADIEAAVEGTAKELEALAASNRYLQDNQQALELLNIEGAHLSNSLRNMQAKSDLAKQLGKAPATDPDQIANNLLESAFSESNEYEDEQIQYYMTLPAPILIKTEALFIQRLDSLMGEWNVCLSSREKIELRLAKALGIRIRVALLFPLLNPEAHLQLLEHKVQPQPGTSSGEAAREMLSSVLEDLQLEPEQKAAMINALRDYREGVACLRAEMAMAQLKLCVGPGAMGPFPDPEKGTMPGLMSTRAETSISTSESASILGQMPYRMVRLYTELAAAVLEPLSAVQNAKLLLGCRPALPDYLVLCDLVSQSGKI
jgi:hypothetical protein